MAQHSIMFRGLGTTCVSRRIHLHCAMYVSHVHKSFKGLLFSAQISQLPYFVLSLNIVIGAFSQEIAAV